MEVEPIGWVSSTRTVPVDDDWDRFLATITLDDGRFTPAVLAGLDAFSHVEVVYRFHLVDEAEVELGARHPRNNPAWPEVGIFAQRARRRPNRLGVSVCRLLNVNGLTLTLQGLDAIDGTPVLDLKPYVVELAPRGEIRQPAWTTELFADYWTT
jgi:tRNA (Thr-GGU) A37 N-methylase